MSSQYWSHYAYKKQEDGDERETVQVKPETGGSRSHWAVLSPTGVQSLGVCELNNPHMAT